MREHAFDKGWANCWTPASPDTAPRTPRFSPGRRRREDRARNGIEAPPGARNDVCPWLLAQFRDQIGHFESRPRRFGSPVVFVLEAPLLGLRFVF